MKEKHYVYESLIIGLCYVCLFYRPFMENQYYYALGQVSYGNITTPMTSHTAATYHAPIYSNPMLTDEEEFNVHSTPLYNQLDSNSSGNNSNQNSLLNKNFASRTAVRDFNENVPVVVLNSNFVPTKGVTVYSDPRDRL